MTLATDASMCFNLPEFTVAIARKFGAPVPQLLPYIGTTVRSEGRFQKVRVDQYGNGVASAPEVKGGHVSAAHNWINFDTMTQVLNSGACNGAYKGCLTVEAETRGGDNIEKSLEKMIPGEWIGRFLLNAPFNSPPNCLGDCEAFVKFKTLRRLPDSYRGLNVPGA